MNLRLLLAFAFALVIVPSCVAQVVDPFSVQHRAGKVKKSYMIVALDTNKAISKSLKSAVEENWNFSSYRFGTIDSLYEYLANPGNSVLCYSDMIANDRPGKVGIFAVFMGSRRVSSLEYADLVTYVSVNLLTDPSRFRAEGSPLFTMLLVMHLQHKLNDVYRGHTPKTRRDKQRGVYYYDNGREALSKKNIYILEGTIPEDKLGTFASNFMMPEERFTFVKENEMLARMKKKDENAAFILNGYAVYDHQGRMLAVGSAWTSSQVRSTRKIMTKMILAGVGIAVGTVGSFALLIHALKD